MFLLTGPRTILRRLIGMIEVAVGNFCVGVDATSERCLELASEISYGVFICDALGIN